MLKSTQDHTTTLTFNQKFALVYENLVAEKEFSEKSIEELRFLNANFFLYLNSDKFKIDQDKSINKNSQKRLDISLAELRLLLVGGFIGRISNKR
jgi:hypothetical protein